MITKLEQAMRDACDAVNTDRIEANDRFGLGLFDAAIEHQLRRKLSANVAAGTTRDSSGVQSRFLEWTLEDAAGYAGDYRHFVWSSFFRPAVMNSASRLSRGLSA